MNFFDAKLVKENDRYYVEIENVRIDLAEEKQANLLKAGVNAVVTALIYKRIHKFLQRINLL